MDRAQSFLRGRMAANVATIALALVLTSPAASRAGHYGYHGRTFGYHRHYLGIYPVPCRSVHLGYLNYGRYERDWYGVAPHYYDYYDRDYAERRYDERYYPPQRFAPRVYAFTIRPQRRDYGELNGRPLIDWSHRESSRIARQEDSGRGRVNAEQRRFERASRGRLADRREDPAARTRRYRRLAR